MVRAVASGRLRLSVERRTKIISTSATVHDCQRWHLSSQFSLAVLAEVDNAASASLLEFRQLLVSDIVRDSVAAIETSGDWRLVVTRAYRAFALPVSYACDGVGPEIEQLVISGAGMVYVRKHFAGIYK